MVWWGSQEGRFDIYLAGDVEDEFKQIVIAAGYGTEAAMTFFEDLINPYWQQKQAG